LVSILLQMGHRFMRPEPFWTSTIAPEKLASWGLTSTSTSRGSMLLVLLNLPSNSSVTTFLKW